MFLGAFAALALTAAPGAALVQDAAPQNPAPEKKVCRSATPTGSIVPKRVCHTKTEWAQIDAGNAKRTEQFRDSRGNGTAVPTSRL